MDRWLDASGHTVRVVEHGTCDLIRDAKEDVAVIFLSSFDLSDYTILYDAIQNGKKVTICLDAIENDFIYNFIDMIDDEDDIPRRFSEIGTGRYSILDDFNFMQNSNLIADSRADTDSTHSNYYTAWSYTGALDTENKGILVVRNAKAAKDEAPLSKQVSRTLWQLAKEKGAALPITYSVIALIVFGFWMCLAPFGKAKPEYEMHGKLIRERFLSEARFYQKHGLLHTYEKYFSKNPQSKKVTVETLQVYLNIAQKTPEKK